MRVYLLFISLLFTGALFSQEKKVEIERLWLSANCSFAKYYEFGAHVQIFEQLLLGAYFQNFRRNVGPGIPKKPHAFLYSPHSYKQDQVGSISLMVGFASPTPHGVMLSFLVGPSFNKCTTNSDFEVTYSSNSASNYSYPVAVSSTVTEQYRIGLNYKATLSFIKENSLCFNVGLAGNHNGIDNYYRFIFGVGLGDFGRKKRISKYTKVIVED